MKAERPEITVVSLNYDRTVRKTWAANLISSGPGFVELAGFFDRDITHPTLGNIHKGTLTVEYFWPDRWFNIFKFLEPDGRLKYFYCNIAMPPEFVDGKIEYVDLDIDVIVLPDGSPQILDEDDFAISAKRFQYSDDLVARVKAVLKELLELLDKKEFPFDELT